MQVKHCKTAQRLIQKSKTPKIRFQDIPGCSMFPCRFWVSDVSFRHHAWNGTGRRETDLRRPVHRPVLDGVVHGATGSASEKVLKMGEVMDDYGILWPWLWPWLWLWMVMKVVKCWKDHGESRNGMKWLHPSRYSDTANKNTSKGSDMLRNAKK